MLQGKPNHDKVTSVRQLKSSSFFGHGIVYYLLASSILESLRSCLEFSI